MSSLFLNFYLNLSNSTVSIKEFARDLDDKVGKARARRKTS